VQSEGNLGLWILVGGGLLLWLLYFQGGGSAVTSGPTTGTPLDAWAQAIADFESGGNPNALNYRNNNPGNLKYAGQPGATGQDSRGFAIFGSLQDGWDALTRQLQKYVNDHPDFTLLQMMTLYLGGNPYAPVTTGQGNPFTYAQSIADKLGVQVSSTLRQIFG
jgi:hypothetical protein